MGTENRWTKKYFPSNSKLTSKKTDCKNYFLNKVNEIHDYENSVIYGIPSKIKFLNSQLN